MATFPRDLPREALSSFQEFAKVLFVDLNMGKTEFGQKAPLLDILVAFPFGD